MAWYLIKHRDNFTFTLLLQQLQTIKLYATLTSVLNEILWSALRSGRFAPVERTHVQTNL